MVVKRMLVTSTPATVSVVTFTSAAGSMVARLSRFCDCRSAPRLAAWHRASRTIPTYGLIAIPAGRHGRPADPAEQLVQPAAQRRLDLLELVHSPFAPLFPSCSRSARDAPPRSRRRSVHRRRRSRHRAPRPPAIATCWPAPGSAERAHGAVHADRVVLEGERRDDDVRQRSQLLVQQVAHPGVGGAHLVAHGRHQRGDVHGDHVPARSVGKPIGKVADIAPVGEAVAAAAVDSQQPLDRWGGSSDDQLVVGQCIREAGLHADSPLAARHPVSRRSRRWRRDELKLPPSASAQGTHRFGERGRGGGVTDTRSTPVAGGRSVDGSSGWSSTVTATVPSNQGAMSLL